MAAQPRRIGQPVDRGDWGMTPQTINAYYNRRQQPDHLPGGDPAAALSSIPTRIRRSITARSARVIGHEIGHGFDDQGRRFDARGGSANWWTPQDRTRFTERTARLGAQYDAYEPLPGLNINGALTMGENIGDLAASQSPMPPTGCRSRHGRRR